MRLPVFIPSSSYTCIPSACSARTPLPAPTHLWKYIENGIHLACPSSDMLPEPFSLYRTKPDHAATNRLWFFSRYAQHTHRERETESPNTKRPNYTVRAFKLQTRINPRRPLRAARRCDRRSARVKLKAQKRRNPWEKFPFLPCWYAVYIPSWLYTKSTTFLSKISDMHALCKRSPPRWQIYKEATSIQFFINFCMTLMRLLCRIHTTP